MANPKSVYLGTVLLISICLPESEGEIQVALKLMTPILNSRYYVQCDVGISPSEADSTFFNYPVVIKDNNLECQVENWRYCNNKPPPQQHGVCGCSGKETTTDERYIFKFYLLIDPVSNIFIGSQFICEVHTARDTRLMETVSFTRTPKRTVYTCVNKTIVYDWEFAPFRDHIVNRYKVSNVIWTSQTITGANEYVLGTFEINVEGKIYFHNFEQPRNTLANGTTRLPQLSCSNIELLDSNTIITIKVTFDQGLITFIQPLTGLVPRSEGAAFFGKMKPTALYLGTFTTPSDNGASNSTNDNAIAQLTTTETISMLLERIFLNNKLNIIEDKLMTNSLEDTTESSNPTTAIEITTPKPIDFELGAPITFMVDSIFMIVAEPPSPETTVSIRAYESITGNLVITCQVYLPNPGHPPINVSIWRDDKLLISRSGIKVLHYSTTKEGGNSISCGLEGHAMNCLPENDKRRNRVTIDLKDTEKTIKPLNNNDLFLSLYAWESIICLVLMLWTISLFLDHIKYEIARARAKLVEENLEVLRKEDLRIFQIGDNF